MRLDSPPDFEHLSLNVLTGPFEGRIEQPIELLDTTLREGEQAPGNVFSVEEKLDIARALDDFGLHWISLGFPAVSAEERAIVTRINQIGLRAKTAALARMVPGDIDAAVDCGCRLVALFLGGSDSHLYDKLRLSEDQALDRIQSSVRYGKERGAMVSFGVEDFSRAPLARVLRFYQAAIEAGADQLTFPDTLGALTPTATSRLFPLFKALLPVPLVVHFHNDLGLALANTLAALESGAAGAHVTVNGVGERTGNTCLEELAVVLKLKYGRDLGFRLDRLDALSRLVHRACGTAAGPHKPVVGRDAFTHESGIHVAGMLANRECYQTYPPELVGRHHEIVFGKHSGAQGITALAESAGLVLSESGRKSVLERVKRAAEASHGCVAEETILGWIREEAEAPVATGTAG
jgi:isopropylmalate/homocitrate/citramalate synthase